MTFAYPFTKEFLLRMLSAIYSDKPFGLRVVKILNPSLIANPILSSIYSQVIKYAKNNNDFPAFDIIAQGVYQQHKSGSLTYDDYKKARAYLKKASRITSSREEISFILKDAVLEARLGEALRSSVRLHRTREFQRIKEEIDGVFSEVAGLEIAHSGRSMASSVAEYIAEVDAGSAKVRRIPLGVDEIDKRVGGLGRGELGCILGGRKAGKTSALIYIAQTAVLCGLKVVYISLEVLRQDVENAMNAGLVDARIKDVLSRRSKKLHDLPSIFSRGGDYYVERFDPKSVTVDDIAIRLQELLPVLGRIDVLCVDYADEIRTEAASTYEAGDALYSGLIRLGTRFNCAVWTASQIKREYLYAEFYGMEAVDKSIDKYSKVSLGISICQTRDELAERVARLYIACCRFEEADREDEDIVGPYSRRSTHGQFFDPSEAGREKSVQRYISEEIGNIAEAIPDSFW